jgi:hypothetical protein
MFHIKIGKFAQKLIDFVDKLILIEVITQEFASFQALRNDTVDKI